MRVQAVQSSNYYNNSIQKNKHGMHKIIKKQIPSFKGEADGKVLRRMGIGAIVGMVGVALCPPIAPIAAGLIVAGTTGAGLATTLLDKDKEKEQKNSGNK